MPHIAVMSFRRKAHSGGLPCLFGDRLNLLVGLIGCSVIAEWAFKGILCSEG